MSIDDWRSQIKRGTLEFCILLMISQKPRYGYEIINELEGWSILAAKESTVYPLLRRLMKDEFLTSFWKETTEGLPPTGRQYLAAMSEEWDNLVAAIAGIKGETEYGQDIGKLS